MHIWHLIIIFTMYLLYFVYLTQCIYFILCCFFNFLFLGSIKRRLKVDDSSQKRKKPKVNGTPSEEETKEG